MQRACLYLWGVIILIGSEMSIEFHRTYYSPMNNSSSKQLFSFSRSPRFQPTRISECKKVFYEVTKGAIEKRAASFGFGQKTQFANLEPVPGAGHYKRQGELEMGITKRRGFSFGRDQNRSLIDNPQQVRRHPGPGAYLSINQKQKTGLGTNFASISYSMGLKLDDPLSKAGNPLGPDHYPTYGGISERGYYFDSKYANSKSPKLGKDRRFQPNRSEAPGPGYYHGEQKANINGTGTYVQSKFLSTKGSSFGRAERPSPAKKNQAPDPGTYHRFSDFGMRNNEWKRGLSF